MTNWFEVKIRFEKTMENGMTKKITETHMLDALSFAESENNCIEELRQYISGEFTVVSIKRTNYSEVFFSDEASADRYFKCKLLFITLDECTGSEKKTPNHILVQAADLRDAVNKLDEGMKGTMADYQIALIAETPIIDVHLYQPQTEQ